MSGAKKRVPKRRFKEFLNAGDWEQRKLRNLLEQPITDGPHETPELYNSGIPFISVDAIVDNKIDFTKMRGYISKEYDDICAKKYKPQINDVYLVKSGATIGKVAIVDTYDDFNIWSPLAAMRCGSITNPYFLYILLQTQDLQSQVFNKASHGTQPNLSMRQLEQFTCKVPKIEEQKLISRFLKQLDDVITLHQRKLDKLQATKKALLQEMFPEEGQDKPKRRFKGFADAWEQRKLDEVCNVYDGTHQTPRYTNSGVMFISVEDIETLESNKYISEEDFKSEFKVFPEYGDILLTRIGDVGSANVILDEIKRAYYVSLALLKPKNINSLFLLALLDSSSVQSEIWRRTLHIAFPKKINKNEINKVIVKQPSIPEQEKIGKLFFSLDQTITLYQRKLDKLKNLKQAYLNEMFV